MGFANGYAYGMPMVCQWGMLVGCGGGWGWGPAPGLPEPRVGFRGVGVRAWGGELLRGGGGSCNRSSRDIPVAGQGIAQL